MTETTKISSKAGDTWSYVFVVPFHFDKYMSNLLSLEYRSLFILDPGIKPPYSLNISTFLRKSLLFIS